MIKSIQVFDFPGTGYFYLLQELEHVFINDFTQQVGLPVFFTHFEMSKMQTTMYL